VQPLVVPAITYPRARCPATRARHAAELCHGAVIMSFVAQAVLDNRAALPPAGHRGSSHTWVSRGCLALLMFPLLSHSATDGVSGREGDELCPPCILVWTACGVSRPGRRQWRMRTGRRRTAASRVRTRSPFYTRPGPPLTTSRPVEPRYAYARAPGAMVSKDVTAQVRTERRVRLGA
jgi:hypothetical protein